MDFSLFKEAKRFFIITMFLNNDTLKNNEKEITDLSNQKNVKLVVQPSPYEAIEFLYQIADDLHGHFRSLEKEIFWEAIELRFNTPKDVMEKIGEIHHLYLCGILEQNVEKVKINTQKLMNYSPYFAFPLAKRGKNEKS